MTYPLTHDQLKFWHEHGYLQLEDFLTPYQKNQMSGWCNEITAWEDTPGKWMKYYEKNLAGVKQLCRIENFLDYHPGLNEIACSQQTLSLLKTLMGEEACLFKEKINFKYPQGSGFKPHQDAPAFVTFKQNFHITMMIAIDDCTLANGCVQVAANRTDSQQSILPQASDGSIISSIADEISWRAIECKQGEVLLFDSYLPHYSAPNHTDCARRLFFMTFNKLSQGGRLREKYFADKRENFPPECEMDPDKDYSQGAAIYNVANPISIKHD